MSDIILKCTNLISPQRESLPPIDLQLERNTLACLAGPADSGKTFCLRLLGGLDEPTGGSLEILGRDVWKLDAAARRELRRQVGYVLPNSALLSAADALQNLSLPADYHRTDTATGIEQRARQLLQWLDYPAKYLATPAAELPACHQRLVAIARCLMLSPEILFVDDAFAYCDRAMRAGLAARYLDMKTQLDMTLVLATDDMEFARQYADVLLYILPQGLRIHDNRSEADRDGFLRLLNREGVDDYTRAIEG
jgi:ABC-type methionine transport system ATPase subunit